MSFQYPEYFILVVVIFSFCLFFVKKKNHHFFLWIEDYWFYKRSKFHRLSTMFYFLGLFLLMLALLDLRGPEKKITAKASDQKTIILIDTSASMLAEDVRPNRFRKALLLAKHFVKKAVGHTLSLVVFSDGQKKIVPFTDDYNLLEARIDSLRDLNLSKGGSNLSLAIQEAIQYFKETSEEVKGNILIITDAEETSEGFQLNIPDTISVGIVGIGTSKGSTIPVRGRDGSFRGKKKYQGQLVISKLDTKFLEGLKSKIKYYDYWIATSYSLPTEKILSFFSRAYIETEGSSEYRIRPVYLQFLVVPGMIFFFLSFLLKRRKAFVLSLLLGFILINTQETTYANEEKKDGPVKSSRTLELEEAFAKGELDEEGKKALATSLLKDNFSKEASLLYDEILTKDVSETNKVHKFNQATALLKSGKLKESFSEYQRLLGHLESNPSDDNQKLEKIIKENILKAFKSGKKGKGKGKGKNKKKGKKGKDKQKQKGDSQEEDKKKDKSDNQSDDKKEDEKKDESSGSEKKKEEEKKNKNENAQEKKERKKKVPALLKQLINDDNQLQKKLIDAKTNKRKSSEVKDW